MAAKYPLNEHANAMLGLGPEYFEPVWDDIPTDENKRWISSDSESNSADEKGDLLALEDTGGDAGIDA